MTQFLETPMGQWRRGFPHKSGTFGPASRASNRFNFNIQARNESRIGRDGPSRQLDSHIYHRSLDDKCGSLGMKQCVFFQVKIHGSAIGGP